MGEMNGPGFPREDGLRTKARDTVDLQRLATMKAAKAV